MRPLRTILLVLLVSFVVSTGTAVSLLSPLPSALDVLVLVLVVTLTPAFTLVLYVAIESSRDDLDVLQEGST